MGEVLNSKNDLASVEALPQAQEDDARRERRRLQTLERVRRYSERRKAKVGIGSTPGRTNALIQSIRARSASASDLQDYLGRFQQAARELSAKMERFNELIALMQHGGGGTEQRDFRASELSQLKDEITGNAIYRAIARGEVSIRISDGSVFSDDFPSDEALGADRQIATRTSKRSRPVAANEARVGSWIQEATARLDQSFPGEDFEAGYLKFKAPVYSGLYHRTEGRYLGGRVVSAFSSRPYLPDDPIRLYVGVPGGGKTHSAVTALLANGGEFIAYAPTSGARAQILALAAAEQAADRVTVVESPRSLEGAPRVLIDEAGRVDPSVIQYLMGARNLYVSGDVGQSQGRPGETLLGVLAALGAPMVVLTKSRRTETPGIQLLSQFVSSTISAGVPDVERIQFRKAVQLEAIEPGDEMDCLAQLKEIHKDMIVVVFDHELKAKLSAAGFRTYLSDEAQGAEADHCAVVFPESWLDRGKTKKIPFNTMINGLCRARKSASLVMSAWGRPLKDLAFKDRDWANDIEGVVTLACADPRVLRPTSADFWPPSHMHAALRLQSHLRRWDYSVDRVGDALLVYKGEKATKYQGAFVLQPGLGEFSAEAYREKGFGFAAAIEVNAPIFDRAQGGVNDEIIALLKPYIAMINDDERARSFRNTVATLAAKSRN